MAGRASQQFGLYGMLMDKRGVVLLLAGLSLLACSPPQSESELLPVSQLSAAVECDVLSGCRVSDAATHIDILFAAPVRALQPFSITVKTEDKRNITSVSANFSMRDMAMGLNRYALVRTSTGEWRGEITLPVCVSGRTDWVAKFNVSLAGRVLVFSLPFVL